MAWEVFWLMPILFYMLQYVPPFANQNGQFYITPFSNTMVDNAAIFRLLLVSSMICLAIAGFLGKFGIALCY